jgi:CRISPR/Cas system CSM-associated protein Csm3 (group 7 of RAMP superfamily)
MIQLILSPDGPILIKAGEKGADPTRPDMEFVRTHHGGEPDVIYLPGSSLKGVLRAHCERIARTVDSQERRERHQREVGLPEPRALTCNPLKDKVEVDKRGKTQEEIRTEERRQRLEWACSRWLGEEKKKREQDEERPPLQTTEIYRWSCFICQVFGHTSLASHLRLTDAYPIGMVVTEERNGVAIDRVFGSVAVGPFNYEVCTQGEFQTTLYLKNFTVAQLGLLALALRDLEAGRVGIGFGKSRGLGRVKASVDLLLVRYPVCQREDGALMILGSGEKAGRSDQLLGLGRFLSDDDLKDYGCVANDWAALPPGVEYRENDWGELELQVTEPGVLKALWKNCIFQWREVAKL